MSETAVDTEVHVAACGAGENRLSVAMRTDVPQCQTDMSVGICGGARRSEVTPVGGLSHLW